MTGLLGVPGHLNKLAYALNRIAVVSEKLNLNSVRCLHSYEVQNSFRLSGTISLDLAASVKSQTSKDGILNLLAVAALVNQLDQVTNSAISMGDVILTCSNSNIPLANFSDDCIKDSLDSLYLFRDGTIAFASVVRQITGLSGFLLSLLTDFAEVYRGVESVSYAFAYMKSLFDEEHFSQAFEELEMAYLSVSLSMKGVVG